LTPVVTSLVIGLKYGQEYVDKGMQYYEDRYCQQFERLQKTAAKVGLHIVEIKAAGRCFW